LLQELVRVLEYRKFALSRADRDDPLSDFLPFAQIADDLSSGCSAAEVSAGKHAPIDLVQRQLQAHR